MILWLRVNFVKVKAPPTHKSFKNLILTNEKETSKGKTLSQPRLEQHEKLN